MKMLEVTRREVAINGPMIIKLSQILNFVNYPVPSPFAHSFCNIFGMFSPDGCFSLQTDRGQEHSSILELFSIYSAINFPS